MDETRLTFEVDEINIHARNLCALGNLESGVKKKNDKRFFTISPRFFHFLLAFKSRLDLNIQLVFNYFFIVQRSERVRAKWSSAGKQSEMYASSKYVESQRKESIVELLLLRGGVWAQHNRLPTTYRPTRDSRFKDLSFSLPLLFLLDDDIVAEREALTFARS